MIRVNKKKGTMKKLFGQKRGFQKKCALFFGGGGVRLYFIVAA